jgi:ankyrin repeat protein
MQNKAEYFRELIFTTDELKMALQREPNLIIIQDETGRTLLHHAANIPCYDRSHLDRLFQILFTAPGLNFTLKDNEGNTPLHIAARKCYLKGTCEFIFPTLISEAARRNFDFSTLGQEGESVLHIATKISYVDMSYGANIFGADNLTYTRANNVLNVLNNAIQPGLNVFSTSGATAFVYAVDNCYLNEAHALLDAGANPTLYSAPYRNPFARIEELIQEHTEILSRFTRLGPAIVNRQLQLLQKINTLKTKMLSFVSASEVSKNAKTLALEANSNSFFKKLPSELLAKISGLTATNGIHTQKDAEEIAAKHFDIPVSIHY